MGRGRQEWLLVSVNGGPESRLPLRSSPTRIGRDGGNQIVLRDDYVSAVHAELVDHRGDRCVRDLGSSNGTRLNGQDLAPATLYALQDGDVLEIGACELTYRCEGVAGRANGQPPIEDGAVSRLQTVAHEQRPGGAVLAPPTPTARRSGWRVAVRAARWLLLGLLVATLVLGSVLWVLSPPRVTLLVLGADARPDELRRGETGRTDTLLTVVADRSPAGLVLISVPRDLWVDLQGFGGARINTAYTIGGPRAAERAVSDVLGVPVDRYLVVGLQGVRDIVDAAGGIEIDVPRPIHDDAYPTDDYGTIVVDIPAGRQRMDGETALRYARTRHQDNDFGRIARQQQVVAALRNAMLQPTNWPRLPAVIAVVRRTTQTDLGPLELFTLAVAAIAGPGEPERLPLDLGLVEEFRGADGAYLLRPRPALRQRVAVVLTPAEAAVEVLNGSRTEGVARQAADRLRERGVRVARVGNALRSQPETTVEVRPGLRRAGLHAGSILDLPREAVRENPLLPEGVDVRITVGESHGR